MEEFHRKIGALFTKALLEEISTAFEMCSIDPIEALYMLDIPTENVAEYGNKKL